MIVCLLFSLISFNCVTSLPLSGHSNIPDGQSIGDYTFNGDDLSSDSSSSLSSSSSTGSSSGLIATNGNNLDSSKDLIELKNLLTDLERQRVLSGLNHKNWKRSCTIDAGMTYNCDFRQLLSAVNARKYLESSMTPGRRKRLLSALLNQPY